MAPVSYASLAGHGLGAGVAAPGVYLGGPVGPIPAPALPFGAGPFGYAGKAAGEGVDYYVSFNN